MKEIQSDIITKEAGVDLHMEVSMEGKTIINRQADSLVGNFLRMLYGMMGEIRRDGDGRRIITSNRNRVEWRKLNHDNDYKRINSINWDADPVHINLYGRADIDDINDGTRVFILDSNVDEMKGIYYNGGDRDDIKLYEVDTFDRRTGSVVQGSPVTWAEDGSNWNEQLRFMPFRFRGCNRAEETLRNPNVVLGANLPNKDAEVEDWWLQNPLEQLSHTGTTVSEPAVQTTKSEITYSRTFTNNQDHDIEVGEIGVICHGPSSRDNYVLMARDNVQSFTIASGKSVTVDYTMTIQNDGNGGVMAQFHQQLYRQHRQGRRVARDINNADRNSRETEGQWMLSATGGGTHPDAQKNGIRGQFLGPIPGTSTKAVSNTNYALTDNNDNDTQIPHGFGDNQLVYYGTVIENIVTDKANDEVYFDVCRILENRGSTTVTVSETGLYTGYNSENSRQDYIRYATMTARHVLDAPVDVPPGELLRLTYRLKLIT